MTAHYSKLRKRAHEILEPAKLGDKTSKITDDFLTTLIILNVLAVTFESITTIEARFATYFYFFEICSIAIFSIEYVMRIWTAPIKFRNYDCTAGDTKRSFKYIFSVSGMIDLLSIAPFYLQFMIPGIDLRILRMLRLLRILKLSTYNSALMDLFLAIEEERKSFFAAGYIFSVMFIVASSLIYYAENNVHPTHFKSIPDSMYWAVITLTTVGYGDITPVSVLGKIIAVFAAIGGVIVVALLTGIVASSFSLQMERRKSQFEDEIRRALEDGVIDKDEMEHLDALRKHFGFSKTKAEQIINDLKTGRG